MSNLSVAILQHVGAYLCVSGSRCRVKSQQKLFETGVANLCSTSARIPLRFGSVRWEFNLSGHRLDEHIAESAIAKLMAV